MALSGDVARHYSEMTKKYFALARYFLFVRCSYFVVFSAGRIVWADGVIGNTPRLSSRSYGFKSRSVHQALQSGVKDGQFGHFLLIYGRIIDYFS